MIDLLEECQRLLNEMGSATALVEADQVRAIAFEEESILGFVITYTDAAHLLDRWTVDAAALTGNHRLSLRRAQTKAWNTYIIFLAGAEPTYGQLIALSAIEEDLVGTRKIARAGIQDSETLREALLQLLPIQNAPRLEAVSMPEEIRLRTTELPPRVVEAFLSGAQESSVAVVLEEEP